MRGTITINGRDIDMVANGATPVIYKRVFRRDFLATTQTEDLDVYSELGFVMAMQAEKPLAELINGLKYEDFIEWISEFEAMDLINHAAEVFALYQAQAQGSSVSKKKK